MTLEEAREHVGDGVVYQAARAGFEPVTDEQRRNDYYNRPAEQGTITSVNWSWVFVRFGGDTGPKDTAPECLTLLAATTGGTQ